MEGARLTHHARHTTQRAQQRVGSVWEDILLEVLLRDAPNLVRCEDGECERERKGSGRFVRCSQAFLREQRNTAGVDESTEFMDMTRIRAPAKTANSMFMTSAI